MENLEGGGNYSTFLFYLHVTAKTSSANSFTPLKTRRSDSTANNQRININLVYQQMKMNKIIRGSW